MYFSVISHKSLKVCVGCPLLRGESLQNLDLKQHTVMTSWLLWVGNLGTAQLGASGSVTGCSQGPQSPQGWAGQAASRSPGLVLTGYRAQGLALWLADGQRPPSAPSHVDLTNRATCFIEYKGLEGTRERIPSQSEI